MNHKSDHLISTSTTEEDVNFLIGVIDSAVDGIISVDANGKILRANPAACHIFQFSKKELIGANMSIMMKTPELKVADVYNNYQLDIADRTIANFGPKVLGKRKDGTIFPFRLSVNKVILKGGVIYTGIVHDVSMQVQAERQLKGLNESLEQKITDRTVQLNSAIEDLKSSNEKLQDEVARRKESELEIKRLLKKEIELGELKSRFVSMASHEFKTPLTGILSSASLIARYTAEEENEQRIKHVGRIQASVANLTGILNEFLSMDRIQSTEVVIHPSEFHIQELISEVAEEMEVLLNPEQRLKCTHRGEEKTVFLDQQMLKHILSNLVSNAIKYAGTDLEIDIRSTLKNDILRLEVEDDGIGIPEEDQPQLFSRFFRAQNTVNLKGTGLGLNIVKRYVEIMNGFISFTSKEGIGTTFTVDLPSDLSIQTKGK